MKEVVSSASSAAAQDVLLQPPSLPSQRCSRLHERRVLPLLSLHWPSHLRTRTEGDSFLPESQFRLRNGASASLRCSGQIPIKVRAACMHARAKLHRQNLCMRAVIELKLPSSCLQVRHELKRHLVIIAFWVQKARCRHAPLQAPQDQRRGRAGRVKRGAYVRFKVVGQPETVEAPVCSDALC